MKYLLIIFINFLLKYYETIIYIYINKKKKKFFLKYTTKLQLFLL